MTTIQCPECNETGTAPGLRRHRSAAHDYPSRAEFIDRFFDDRPEGTSQEVLAWLRNNYPEANWPYPDWTQSAVSRDLSQHKNYPRRWDIVCEGRGPGARWQRTALRGEERDSDRPDDELVTQLARIRDELTLIVRSLNSS